MQCNLSVSRWVLASMTIASIASAQTNRVVTPADVECNCLESLNRFGISYRTGFNISAKFKNLGGFTSQNPPGVYDDGYNLMDISGNAGDLTWNWGYENASQLPGNDTLVLSSSSSTANGTSDDQEDEPQHGIEFSYNRQLGRIGECKWGIEAAFAFNDVTIDDDSPVATDSIRSPFAYALGGTIPPLAPYQGTFAGPGPLISSIATPLAPIVTAGGALVTGKRQFDSEIYGLRVGPYLEIPMTERLSFSLSGGFALLAISSDFKYRETTGSQTQSGSGSHSEWLPGGYFGGNFNYALCENVNLFAGAQYQTAGTYSHKENGKEVELDLGESVFLNLGIGFSF